MKDILFVEDDPNIAKTLLFILSKSELTTDHVTSIADAKELFRKEQYGLFLFDIGLADGSGIDLTKFIRKNDSEKQLFLLQQEWMRIL